MGGNRTVRVSLAVPEEAAQDAGHPAPTGPSTTTLSSLTGKAVTRAVGLLVHTSPDAPAANPLDIQRAAAAALATVPVHPWTGEQRHALAGFLGVYLWRAWPPSPWRLAAVEPAYPGGAADLLWEHPDGRRLLDELKIDSMPATHGGHRRKVLQQLERHTAFGIAEFGEQYLGLRLLTLSTPRRSLFIPPAGQRVALLTTPWCTEGGW